MRKPKYFLVESVCNRPVQVIYSSNLRYIMKYAHDILVENTNESQDLMTQYTSNLRTDYHCGSSDGWSLTILESEDNS